MADEMIDILNDKGIPTGEARLKSEAHRLGLYHASVHIWIYTKEGKILLQKRSYNKDTYPNLWDVSVAGHIEAGESPENSAIREIKEEIGIYISNNNLEYIGIYLAEKKPKPNLYDNEFHHIYLLALHLPIHKFTLQSEEVAQVDYIDINIFKDKIMSSTESLNYVPHDPAYFELVLDEISNRL
ncbi:hypothetical protein AWE51_20900 [Aquimarina aggregata]|uniref:Nudix hydrolase domain-containing protein n=1 Tax=Aquimarina aggregata TaxID=1642818 RepID=A0A163BJZ3_9FLAO|nr:NUDIX domain-containing protein [Aquimarina aggregata]KZS41475.1 hypothetical protein AWE51_20900 [Aquimarina aggregata]